MNLFNFSNHNLDELVFEQRNKAYGAYAIRKAYPTHLNKSMVFTLAPFLFVLLSAITWNYFHPIPLPKFTATAAGNEKKPPITDIITCGGGFTFILDDPSAGFEIVIDKKVKPVVKKKETIKPIERAIGSTQSQGMSGLPVGRVGGMIGAIGGLPGGTKIQAPLVIEDFAAKMPEYIGGIDAMYAYIRQNLNYPRLAIDNSISGKVVVSFVIMPDGSVQMTNLERGIGFGCDEEAMRVISEMPNWEPAEQNGKKVPVRLLLPVVFQTVN